MRKGLLVKIKIKSWIQEEEKKNVKYDAIKYFSFVM